MHKSAPFIVLDHLHRPHHLLPLWGQNVLKHKGFLLRTLCETINQNHMVELSKKLSKDFLHTSKKIPRKWRGIKSSIWKLEKCPRGHFPCDQKHYFPVDTKHMPPLIAINRFLWIINRCALVVIYRELCWLFGESLFRPWGLVTTQNDT